MNKKHIALLALTAVAAPAVNVFAVPGLDRISEFATGISETAKAHKVVSAGLTADFLALGLFTYEYFANKKGFDALFEKCKELNVSDVMEVCKENPLLGAAVVLALGGTSTLGVKGAKNGYSFLKPGGEETENKIGVGSDAGGEREEGAGATAALGEAAPVGGDR